MIRDVSGRVRPGRAASAGYMARARVAGLMALLFAALTQVVGAQENASTDLPAVFAQLEGRWVGSGELLGRPAEFLMIWESGTEGFVRLTFSNSWVNEDGTRTPVLSSEATYLPGGSSAIGVWLDDRPQRLTLEATLTDSTLTTNWKAEAEEGRTDYVVRSSGEVLVRDVVYVEGVERRFAVATYQRAPDSR